MPPPPLLCLPGELTEFEVVRGGSESSGLSNFTLEVLDLSAKLSLLTHPVGHRFSILVTPHSSAPKILPRNNSVDCFARPARRSAFCE
jgi:hypothetical protein